MNRAQRRMQAKTRQAMGIELARMEKPEAYQQGYLDGGKAMIKACYASAAEALADLGFHSDMIVQILRGIDERLIFFAGEEEKQRTAWTDAGLEICLDEVFTEDRIDRREN